MTDLNRRCIESWRRILTGYQIKEWNDKTLIFENEYCRQAYDKRLWSRLSNHVRLHALYTEGGIYLDTDVEVLKDFEPLLKDRCFLGFQQPKEDADWINSAVLGALPNHPFIRRCLKLTQALHTETGEFFRSPSVVTTVLRNMGLTNYGTQEIAGVKIYPAEYFYPFPWFSKFSADCITDKTYCIHHWEGSWLNQSGAHPGTDRHFKQLVLGVRRRIYKMSKRLRSI